MAVPGRQSTSTVEQRSRSGCLLAQPRQECIIWPVQFFFLAFVTLNAFRQESSSPVRDQNSYLSPFLFTIVTSHHLPGLQVHWDLPLPEQRKDYGTWGHTIKSFNPARNYAP